MAGRKTAQGHSISGVFVFLLLGLFAVFSTVMVLLGARAYRNVTQAQAAHNAGRIAPAYMRSMVRAADETGTIRIAQADDGSDMLVFEQTYDDEDVVTYIYCHEGTLLERFASADLEFEPGEGETVCPLDGMRLSLREGLLNVVLTLDGQDTEMNIALYSAL